MAVNTQKWVNVSEHISTEHINHHFNERGGVNGIIRERKSEREGGRERETNLFFYCYCHVLCDDLTMKLVPHHAFACEDARAVLERSSALSCLILEAGEVMKRRQESWEFLCCMYVNSLWYPTTSPPPQPSV